MEKNGITWDDMEDYKEEFICSNILGTWFEEHESEFSKNRLIVAYDYLDDSMKETQYGLVDIEGNVIIPFIFDHISEVKGNFAKVLCEQDGKMETEVIKIVQK